MTLHVKSQGRAAVDQLRKQIREARSQPRAIEEIRAEQEQRAATWRPPEGIELQETEMRGVPADHIRTRDGEPSGTLLYFHGGAYVIGSRRTSRSVTATLAQRTGAAVWSSDYRLAPKHAFPAAVEDATSAYEHLLDLGVSATRIAVAGASAGGGLTLCLLLAVRKRGLPLPACAAVISPWTDLTCSGQSYETKAEADPIITRRALLGAAAAYLAGTDARSELASPNFADLSGLPPLLIQVGTDECLLDDSVALDAQARRCGVDSTLEIWEDMIHVWHNHLDVLSEAHEALERITAFCRKHAWS
jgi:acetyl esterase/lipase